MKLVELLDVCVSGRIDVMVSDNRTGDTVEWYSFDRNESRQHLYDVVELPDYPHIYTNRKYDLPVQYDVGSFTVVGARVLIGVFAPDEDTGCNHG